ETSCCHETIRPALGRPPGDSGARPEIAALMPRTLRRRGPASGLKSPARCSAWFFGRAAAEQQLAAEIAEENRAYCEKWGMRAGTREHSMCTLDLDEIRARHSKRLAVGVEGLI